MTKVCSLFFFFASLVQCILARDHAQFQNQIQNEEEIDPMSKVFDLVDQGKYRTVSDEEPVVEIWKLAGQKRDFGHRKNAISSKNSSSRLGGKEQTSKQGRRITKKQNSKQLKQRRKEERVENRKKSKINANKKVYGKRVKKPMRSKSKVKRKYFKTKGKRQKSQNHERQQERKDKRQQLRLRKSSKKKNKNKKKNKYRHWRTIEVYGFLFSDTTDIDGKIFSQLSCLSVAYQELTS